VDDQRRYTGWRVGFDIYRHRAVALPGGRKALVVVRRNVQAKPNWFNSLDLRWEVQMLRRLFRRDRSWRVEVYADAGDDGVPWRDAEFVLAAADKARAFDLAEDVSARLRHDGLAALD